MTTKNKVLRQHRAIVAILVAHGEVADDEVMAHYGCVCGGAELARREGLEDWEVYYETRDNWIEHVAQLIMEAADHDE